MQKRILSAFLVMAILFGAVSFTTMGASEKFSPAKTVVIKSKAKFIKHTMSCTA